ncbi:polysaccharide deacetylase [Legionella israelensis]|uniref:Polysaccharide deacetylase n=1 Tax=Legionella israelensis TaxID=454 RepID=A0A0W0W1X1_9GAMM|nr:polysaccharide deacetylase family protein [Legionella israelensis]KTD26287.1 polysaccharide deacetylase [Legionella israelensis]QBR83905.1 polysaccharide deacetylase [Legionella israelensis]QBS10788.1 polysaccharide deacetylase [Legionella israelensis]QDP72997.1 polysaccharide deacetylase family protein [Legionella israelensis]SCY33415.1 Peptidoglycan/xylan/chitin deacetylase, PgdA/CDA1 family [Legionella israelensis DSM 19235]
MNKNILLLLILIFGCTTGIWAAQLREIAITIDDLPFVGTTYNKPGNLRREQERFLNIMNALIRNDTPATGFVIGGSIEKDQWQLLQLFHDEGFTIANHTYSHANLNHTNAEKYIQDIKRADEILTPLMTETKYFRYPYLADGKGSKKEQVMNYLAENNYIIAPVTIDSKDFKFNAQLLAIHWRSRSKHLDSIKNRYLSYIWQQTLRAERISEKKYGKPMPQILLIHANLLNSHVMDDIIQMYKKNGYTFVSLDKAMNEYKQIESRQKDSSQQEEAESIENTDVEIENWTEF